MNDVDLNHHSQPWRAHDELPEAVVGYGTAEIACILSCHTGAQIEQTRTALAYDRDQISDDIITAGASSLLARGQAHITGETVELTGPATSPPSRSEERRVGKETTTGAAASST